VETFLQDKQQNSRNADAFREFFVQYWRKGAVQNRFLTVAHRPLQELFSYTVRESKRPAERSEAKNMPAACLLGRVEISGFLFIRLSFLNNPLIFPCAC